MHTDESGRAVKAVILDYTGVMTVALPFSPLADDLATSHAEGDRATHDPRAALRSMMAAELRNPDANGAWNRLERGEITLDAFIDRFAPRLGEIAEVFRSSAGQLMASLPIRTEMVDRVARWRGLGLRVGLLTNNITEWRPIWRAKLEEAGALGLFDVIVDSSEVGMRKPEARIFHHTADLLGVTVGDAVFVDDFDHNLAGARGVGLRTLLALPDDSHYAALDALLG